MNDKTGSAKSASNDKKDDRKARLAAELRANLQKRKAQARLRDRAPGAKTED